MKSRLLKLEGLTYNELKLNIGKVIKDIPKGKRSFNNLSEEKDKIIHLTDVDYEVKKILTDFYGIGNNNDYDAYAYAYNCC